MRYSTTRFVSNATKPRDWSAKVRARRPGCGGIYDVATGRVKFLPN